MLVEHRSAGVLLVQVGADTSVAVLTPGALPCALVSDSPCLCAEDPTAEKIFLKEGGRMKRSRDGAQDAGGRPAAPAVRRQASVPTLEDLVHVLGRHLFSGKCPTEFPPRRSSWGSVAPSSYPWHRFGISRPGF